MLDFPVLHRRSGTGIQAPHLPMECALEREGCPSIYVAFGFLVQCAVCSVVQLPVFTALLCELAGLSEGSVNYFLPVDFPCHVKTVYT